MPFWSKKGDDYVRLRVPTDIRDDKQELLVSIYPDDPHDAEKVTVDISGDADVVVITERLDRIFPG